VFHSNYGPNALYEIRGEKRIIAEVPYVCIFNAAAEGVPWNIVTAVGLKKMPYQTVKKSDDISIRLDTLGQTETDRFAN